MCQNLGPCKKNPSSRVPFAADSMLKAGVTSGPQGYTGIVRGFFSGRPVAMREVIKIICSGSKIPFYICCTHVMM